MAREKWMDEIGLEFAVGKSEEHQEACLRYQVALAVRMDRAGYPGKALEQLKSILAPDWKVGELLQKADQLSDAELLVW